MSFISTKKLLFLALIIGNLSTLIWISPLQENLSLLANGTPTQLFLIVWGTSAAMFFYCYTHQLMKQFHYPYRFLRYCLLLSCLSMALSVFLPYDAADFPILSKWHVRLAMLGVASYLLLFFHLLTDIMKKDYTFYIKSMSYYTTLVILEALFFLLYGSVTALLEVSFITIMATLLYAMSEDFFMSS